MMFYERLMPSFLRRSKHVAWIRALLVRLLEIKNEFATIQINTDKKRKYNSQSLSIQSYLQSQYGSAQITIVNTADQFDRNYAFFLSENQTPKHVGVISESLNPVVYVYFLSELVDPVNNYDFIVRVPSSLSLYVNQISADVDCLRLASKRFKVEIF